MRKDGCMAWKPYLVILLAALVIRLGACWWWQTRLAGERLFFFPDSESYWHLGRAIARGEPYCFGQDGWVFRTPGYPALLAAVISVFGEGRSGVYAARCTGAVLGTGAVLLTGLWAGRVAGARAGWCAASLAACYPGAVALSVFVLSEALFCPLLIAQLFTWSLADAQLANSRRAVAWAAVSGVFAGAATLCRPSWLLFTPVLAVLWVLSGRASTRRSAAAVMLGIFVVTLVPWWVRNYLVVHRFVPTTLQVGASLYDGWNPQATGASAMEFVEVFRTQLAQEGWPPGPQREWELDRRLFRAAVQWAGEHPVEVCRLAGIKFLRLWSLWPNDPQLRSRPLAWVLAVFYVPVLALTVAEMRSARPWKWNAVLIVSPALYLTALHVVFVSSVRYREPGVMVWLVMAGAQLAALLGRTCGREGPTT